MKRQYFYLVKSGILRGLPNDKNGENRPSKNENRQKNQKQQQRQQQKLRRKQEQKQRQKQKQKKQKREKWKELHSWVNEVLDSIERAKRAKTLPKTKR